MSINMDYFNFNNFHYCKINNYLHMTIHAVANPFFPVFLRVPSKTTLEFITLGEPH